MSRFSNILMLVFVVQLTLILFNQPDVPGTALYTFLTNPTDWDNAGWNLLFSDVITGIGLTTAFLGLYIFRSDFVTFAGVILTLYGFGKPLVNLYQVIASSINPLFAILVVSPIIGLYVFCLLEWWRVSR